MILLWIFLVVGLLIIVYAATIDGLEAAFAGLVGLFFFLCGLFGLLSKSVV